MELTTRQRAVLRAVECLTAELGYPPTFRELARRTKLSHVRVRQHMERLAELGAIIPPIAPLTNVK